MVTNKHLPQRGLQSFPRKSLSRKDVSQKDVSRNVAQKVTVSYRICVNLVLVELY